MGSMRFRDMHMKGTAAIAAQLCDADQFMTASHRRMDFSMQKYVPMCALAIRKIAAGPERWDLPSLSCPKLLPSFINGNRQCLYALPLSSCSSVTACPLLNCKPYGQRHVYTAILATAPVGSSPLLMGAS